MTNTPDPGDLRSLWQTMPTAPITLSVEELRKRAMKFERKVRRRNLVEYLASAFVVVIFGWYATFPIPTTPLWPIANVMIIAGVLVVAWNLHRLARASRPPPGADAASLIDFQRAEYVRQRNALKSVWLWYIGPIIPGLIVWFIAAGVGMPGLTPMRAAIGLGGAALIAALVFSVIILLNLLGAAKLQRLIEDLDRNREH
jgi:amino acid transporter